MAKIFGIDFETKDELIVEAMKYSGRFSAIAKVIVEHRRESDIYTDGGMDEVLKVLNYNRHNIQRACIPDGMYKGLWGYHGDGFAVVFMEENEGCGSNVFIRKHYNLEYGVFLDVSSYGTNWINGKREKAVKIIKRNMYIKDEK